jgi:hypothetical protein
MKRLRMLQELRQIREKGEQLKPKYVTGAYRSGSRGQIKLDEE